MAMRVRAVQKKVIIVTYDVPDQDNIDDIKWRNALFAQALHVAADTIETDENFANAEIDGGRVSLDGINDVISVEFDIVPG
jgi:hypothetical protein